MTPTEVRLFFRSASKRIILITSPFHQLRTYLTFAKVLHPYGIEILNYSADPVRLKCIRTLLLSFFSDEQGDSTPAVEHSHLLVAISLEGETLRSRNFRQREQQLYHLRSTIQLGPMPLLRQEREI